MSYKAYYSRKLEHQIHTIDCKKTVKETIKDIVSTKVTQYMVIYLLLKI